MRIKMDKIDKLWELMRDVDSLEDIYETSEGYYAFVFESPGNIDKRVEQIMNGLDKEGYTNSFEKTFSSEIIIFDIDFKDDLEEGIDYKPKFISDKSIEELQNELNQMYADQYKYGRSIDRPRMWDINYTIKQLEKGLGEAVKFEPKYIPRDWKDVYKLFELLANEEDIRYLCDKHKGEKAWDIACEKWFEDTELDEELENIDGWSDTIINKCEPFFSKAEQVMYGVRNTVRGSYGLGDTVEDLAQVFEELASDAEELAGELRASDDAGELTEDFDINSLSDKEKYMFLDRMKQDCKYFLGNGNRNTKYLFGNSVKEHIESMKELYNSLKEKPEWLSMEDIEEFDRKMTEIV